ncbi:hypothetical protein QT381_01765 [Galbitalea sp. SE-J8]|uniref:hypothetical protein n=1 Tax=Galbitalea sp. SE-J8 TaxID=3054952 RepID=UPI00259CFD21|nr:hypothetical protein [Galbitalea sp. SE-J8]MDM4761729.1 hypothetical protein [Galbitalea sp. SE-J8]
MPTTAASTETDVASRCDDLLDAATIAAFEKRGFVNQSAAYTESLSGDYSPEPDEPSLARFLALGGVVCAWGPVEDEGGVLYAYGPIDKSQADKEREVMIKGGAKTVDSTDFERFTEPYGYAGGYAFLDGHWAAAIGWDPDGDYLAEVVQNGSKQ